MKENIRKMKLLPTCLAKIYILFIPIPNL